MNNIVVQPNRRWSPDAAAARVLVVDDHREARQSMVEILSQAGHQVDSLSSAVEALQQFAERQYDVIVTDMRMPGMDGLEFIRQLEARRSTAQVVMITAHASVGTAVEAMRHGAFDYTEKPFDADRLEDLVRRAAEQRRALGRGTEEGRRDVGRNGPCGASAASGGRCNGNGGSGGDHVHDGEDVMIGDSPVMRALRERIGQVAPTPETVLVHGESGTGKELVAQAIHRASLRSAAEMVSLNCPVLSAQLMESELFGHERGAFTGADTARTGRFELAHGGTILLDEVTEIDLPLQAKLLRVLQEKSFERVGSSRTIHVDVRVLATTNRDLLAEVAAGRFRQDLYYRLAVVPIFVPPLRERAEDVPVLVDHFLHRAARRLDREPAHMKPAAAQLLAEYHWPGNVRELENIVTRASVLYPGAAVDADQLRPWLIDGGSTPATSGQGGGSSEVPVGLSLQEMEQQLIEATLEQFAGHRAKTAEALGIGLRTLSGKLRQYGYRPRARAKE